MAIYKKLMIIKIEDRVVDIKHIIKKINLLEVNIKCSFLPNLQTHNCQQLIKLQSTIYDFIHLNLLLFKFISPNVMSRITIYHPCPCPLSAPMDAPVEVSLRTVSTNAVFVKWRGVSTDQDEEPLEGYKIYYWRQGENIYIAKSYDSQKVLLISDVCRRLDYYMNIYQPH